MKTRHFLRHCLPHLQRLLGEEKIFEEAPGCVYIDGLTPYTLVATPGWDDREDNLVPVEVVDSGMAHLDADCFPLDETSTVTGTAVNYIRGVQSWWEQYVRFTRVFTEKTCKIDLDVYTPFGTLAHYVLEDYSSETWRKTSGDFGRPEVKFTFLLWKGNFPQFLRDAGLSFEIPKDCPKNWPH